MPSQSTFEAVVDTIALAPEPGGGTGDMTLAGIVSTIARSLGRAQLEMDAQAVRDVPGTAEIAAGALPPCYQIMESTVDMNLVLRFVDGETRASYPDLAAPPGAVSTVRVVLRAVAPLGVVLPPPAELPTVRVMAD